MSTEDFDCNLLAPGHSYLKCAIYGDQIIIEDSWKTSEQGYRSHVHGFLYTNPADYAERLQVMRNNNNVNATQREQVKSLHWKWSLLPEVCFDDATLLDKSNCVYCALVTQCPDLSFQKIQNVIDRCHQPNFSTRVAFEQDIIRTMRELYDSVATVNIKPAK